MNETKYWIKTFLLALFLPPLVATASILLAGFLSPLSLLSGFPGGMRFFLILTLPVAGLFLAWLWGCCVAHAGLPDGLLSRYLPIFAAFAYYMLVWIATFGSPAFSLWAFPFSVTMFFLNDSNVATAFPGLLIFLYGLVVATVYVKGARRSKTGQR